MDGAESACSASLAGRGRHVEPSHVARGFGEALGPSCRRKGHAAGVQDRLSSALRQPSTGGSKYRGRNVRLGNSVRLNLFSNKVRFCFRKYLTELPVDRIS
jgi:hypothetical protein